MEKEDLDIDLANWMSQLPDSLLNEPLSAIAIPGSHDSFTSSLDRTSDIGPDASPAVKMLGPLAKGIVYNWSVTQSLDIKNQLLLGIRYLDLRVASKNGTTDIHFVHGLYGPKVEEAFTQIIDFLDAHKQEIVILDFNHFYEMNENHHTDFLAMVTSKFAGKLCLYVGMENLTLNMMRENGLQVIIIYHHQVASENIHLWPGQAVIKAPWANTVCSEDLFTFLDSTYTKSRDGTFHVCQGILSPDTGFILAHMNSTLEKEIAEQLMPDFLKWLQEKQRGLCGVNVVIADFIDKGNFVKTVIAMNFE